MYVSSNGSSMNNKWGTYVISHLHISSHLFSLRLGRICFLWALGNTNALPKSTLIFSLYQTSKNYLFSSWFSILPKIVFSLPDFPFSQKSLNPNSLFSFKWYYIVHGLEPTWEWKYKRRFWIFLCIYTIAIILSTVELSNGDLQSIHTMGFCPQNHDPCLVLLGSVATWVIQYLNYSSKLQS